MAAVGDARKRLERQAQSAENDSPTRHHCGDCGRFVPETSVLVFTDFESGIVDATGECSRCGRMDVTRVIPSGVDQ